MLKTATTTLFDSLNEELSQDTATQNPDLFCVEQIQESEDTDPDFSSEGIQAWIYAVPDANEFPQEPIF